MMVSSCEEGLSAGGAQGRGVKAGISGAAGGEPLCGGSVDRAAKYARRAETDVVEQDY